MTPVCGALKPIMWRQIYGFFSYADEFIIIIIIMSWHGWKTWKCVEVFKPRWMEQVMEFLISISPGCLVTIVSPIIRGRCLWFPFMSVAPIRISHVWHQRIFICYKNQSHSSTLTLICITKK